ncbi:hypothetical protein OHA21_49335 [Actinoplanes sp. NBC_00393]
MIRRPVRGWLICPPVPGWLICRLVPVRGEDPAAKQQVTGAADQASGECQDQRLGHRMRVRAGKSVEQRRGSQIRQVDRDRREAGLPMQPPDRADLHTERDSPVQLGVERGHHQQRQPARPGRRDSLPDTHIDDRLHDRADCADQHEPEQAAVRGSETHD